MVFCPVDPKQRETFTAVVDGLPDFVRKQSLLIQDTASKIYSMVSNHTNLRSTGGRNQLIAYFNDYDTLRTTLDKRRTPERVKPSKGGKLPKRNKKNEPVISDAREKLAGLIQLLTNSIKGFSFLPVLIVLLYSFAVGSVVGGSRLHRLSVENYFISRLMRLYQNYNLVLLKFREHDKVILVSEI
ncbi:hypothetical protein RCL_jg26414.t1 [Rhizophagus clarus]|uniref:Uncharacterized protein n=1 Tax=Rhizophagus clarus TaxID=94130 RepID=A0A8H3LLI5_9GLOM|nr:hypothetical protein RCL_jg26414.t1 [Rhizophagus clarus]